MDDKINVTCSGCGKTSEVPKYSKFGLPYMFYRCTCDAETELTPEEMNALWWRGMWIPLVDRMEKAFGDDVVNKMTAFAIEQRKYILDRDYLHEEYLVPQSLQGSAKE